MMWESWLGIAVLGSITWYLGARVRFMWSHGYSDTEDYVRGPSITRAPPGTSSRIVGRMAPTLMGFLAGLFVGVLIAAIGSYVSGISGATAWYFRILIPATVFLCVTTSFFRWPQALVFPHLRRKPTH